MCDGSVIKRILIGRNFFQTTEGQHIVGSDVKNRTLNFVNSRRMLDHGKRALIIINT